MFGILTRFFDSNEKQINKLKPLVSEINFLEEQVKKLKDKDFPKKTQEFKERIKSGESLELILPEVFAIVREASLRKIGQRHFDVQLMAGIILASGKIAEQKTGEGKTLSAVPALYLHSLTGNNVHLVTVNDYLARRDAGWMGPIFNLLGIKVASIISEKSFVFDPDYVDKEVSDYRLSHLREITRKEAYQTDIVYGINSEFGFDYLRDNMAQDISSVVQRKHYFAVVDEVDSVLIDEARTPHIISAPDESPAKKYYEYANLVGKLNPDIDYKVDEKLRTVHLTDHGLEKIERVFNVKNIYEKDFDTVYHIEAALKAYTLFSKEKDYIVKDSQVILVDEFTGRLMVGRRLSEGLHQALEAKEQVPIQRESKTLATVSLQNYFRMYEKLAGMTGTAATEAEEFHKIYKLDVVVIPTNKSMVRIDHKDSVYKTGRAKLSAVANEIEKIHKKGQPVLLGTTAIDKNELISELLRRRGIKHEILNAKNHEREAQILARAGEEGAVTVATNMAGRGVDIILGGDTPKQDDGKDKVGTSEWKEWEKKHQKVISLGGLYVIGTEKHEARRIDNQLRGRAGRQGDPGNSRFFVSLDDEVMRLFGGDTIAGLMTRFNMPEEVPIQSAIVSRAIEQAQVKIETFNFDIRKHLVEYDDVLNIQRQIIYKKRRKVLAEENSLKKEILENINNIIAILVNAHSYEENSLNKIIDEFVTIIPFDEQSKNQLVKQLEQLPENLQRITFLSDIAKDIYEQREKKLGNELTRKLEKFVMLSVIDNLWIDHLDAVENLRQGIGLRGYGQRDPLVEYKNEAYKMFEKLVAEIDDQIVHRIYKVQIQEAPPALHQPKHIVAKPAGADVGISETSSDRTQNKLSEAPHRLVQGEAKSASGGKIGRNDPCWCGAKKSDGAPIKYKNCHYPN